MQDPCIHAYEVLYFTIKGLHDGFKVLELAHFADADCYSQAIPNSALPLSWVLFP